MERLEARLALSASDITSLTFNIPADVASQGVYAGVYGNSAPKNGNVYYGNVVDNEIENYQPASMLTVGQPVNLVTLVSQQTYSAPQQATLDLPVPTGSLQGLWGGELFVFVGKPTTGLVVASSASGGNVIAAPKAMPDPNSSTPPDNFAQFEFTYTDAVTQGTPAPASLDVDSSAVDSTGFPFALVYPQSSAGFPLNPVGITQTETGIVVNFNSAFSPGGEFADDPQFAQDGQVNSQQVVAPQDILAEENGAPPSLASAQVSDDVPVAGSGSGATLTVNSTSVPVLVGMGVSGTSIQPGTFVTSVAVIAGTTTVGLSAPVTMGGTGNYTFSGNLTPAVDYYFITATSANVIPSSGGVTGETLASNTVKVTVTAGQTVTLAWNPYNDPNTTGYNVYRYITTNGDGPTDTTEYTLIAQLKGIDNTRFTDIGSVSQAQQNAPTAAPPAIAPAAVSSYGFNPLSDYFTQDILDFFNYYRTNTFSMNRVGVLWQGNTVEYTPAAAWNSTTLTLASGFSANATSIDITDPQDAYAGQVLTGPGIKPGTTISGIVGSTLLLSEPTSGSAAAEAAITAQSTYTVLQLTAQNPSGTIAAGDVLNIYEPIFATNTRFVTTDGTAGGPPAPPMPSWLAAYFSPYESPSQMVFACDAVFADNDDDPDLGTNGDLATALGALENSIVAAFNRGIANDPSIPPDNWASFPQMLTPASVSADPMSKLPAGTYYYAVTAVNTLGETTPSLAVKAVVTGNDDQSVTLSWANGSSAPPATEYYIFRGTDPDGPLTFLTGTYSSTFTDHQTSYPDSTSQTPPYSYFQPGSDANWYAAYVQSDSTLDPISGVSINGLSYGFPYSDQGGVSTNLYFSGDNIPGSITLNLGALDNLGFLTQNLANAVPGQPYPSQTIEASGSLAPGATFAASGLPYWLMLSATGVLSLNGTQVVPAEAVSKSFVITATSGSSTASQSFAIDVGSSTASSSLTVPGLNGAALDLPAGENTKSYSTVISVIGGTGAYQASANTSNPFGLTIETSTAAGIPLQGTLDNPPSVTPASFTLLVTDSLNLKRPATWASGDGNVITVQDASALTQGMAVSGNGLPPNTIISQIDPQDGGGAQLTLVSAFNSSTPADPTSGGTFSFDDAVVFAPNIVINPVLQLTTQTKLPDAAAGKPYSVQLTTNTVGESLDFSKQDIPGWLHLTSTGLLWGTAPSSPQPSTSFEIGVRSPYTTVLPQMFSVSVKMLDSLALSPGTAYPDSLPPATEGTPYTATLTASGGDAPYTFTVVNGALPPGLNLSRDTISGTPAATDQAYLFTVRVTDALGESAYQGYEIIVGQVPAQAPPKITSASDQLAQNATVLVLAGTGFDPDASGDTIKLTYSGFAGVIPMVEGATDTQLIVSLTGQSLTESGPAYVAVEVGGQTSFPAHYFGDVKPQISIPTVDSSTAKSALNVSLSINGSGFDTNPLGDFVVFSNSAVTGTVTGASANQLTVALSGLSDADVGQTLSGYVVVDGVPSGAAVTLETVAPYRQAPTVNSYANPPSVSTSGNALTISGTGFDPSDPAANMVTLTDSGGALQPNTVQSVIVNSANELTVLLAQPLPVGMVYATVSVDGVASNHAEIALAASPMGPSIQGVTPRFALAGTTLVIPGSGLTPLSYFGTITTTNQVSTLALSSVDGLSAGMQVYGPGIQAGTTIASTDMGQSTVTLSIPANPGSATGAFVFTTAPNLYAPPGAAAERWGTSGDSSDMLTLANTLGLYAGLEVSGPGLSPGTTVTMVDSPTEVTLSGEPGPGAGSGTFDFHLVTWNLHSITSQKFAISPKATDVVAGMSVVGLSVPSGTTVQSNSGGFLTVSKAAPDLAQADFFSGATVLTGTTTDGSDQLTGIDTTGLSVGMLVFGPGAVNDATIVAIDAQDQSLTLSSPATGSAPISDGTGTFAFVTAPTSAVCSTGASTNSSTIVSGMTSTSGLFPGMVVTGPGIQAGTTIVSVQAASQQVTLSVPADQDAGNGTFTFVAYPVDLSGIGSTSGNPSYQSLSVDSPDQITLSGLQGLVGNATLAVAVGNAGSPTPVASVSTSISASAPTVMQSTASLTGVTTFNITGDHFDSSGTNVLTLYDDGAALPLGFLETVVANSATQIAVTLGGPLPSGTISATVITDGLV
jgi:hypothetical protein